jgi:hypothetical protein
MDLLDGPAVSRLKKLLLGDLKKSGGRPEEFLKIRERWKRRGRLPEDSAGPEVADAEP